MKVAGTIEKFVRRELKAKLCQQTLMKQRPRHLDTPHLIFKIHKTMCSEQSSLQQFLCISFCFFFFFFFFSFFFVTAHEGKSSSQKYKTYARTRRGMRLMHDGATTHTARKTVNLLQASRVNVH